MRAAYEIIRCYSAGERGRKVKFETVINGVLFAALTQRAI